MSNAEFTPALVDQMIVQALDTISENPDFNDNTLRRLQELAKSGGLAKYERVVSALSMEEEE